MKPVSDKQKTADLNAKQPKKLLPATRTRKRLLSDRSLLVGLGCLASLGLLSKGIVWAQTEIPQAELAIPAEAEPQPAFEAPPPAPEPDPIQEAAPPAPEPEPYVAPAPEIAPEPVYIEPAPPREYAPEPPAAAAPPAPDYYLPEPALIPLPEPTAQEPPFEAPVNPANAYIDSTDYSLGATNGYESPTAIEFAERSTGCQGVVSSGQGVGDLCGSSPVSEPVTADAGPGNNSPQNPIADNQYIASPPPNRGGNTAGNIGGNTGMNIGRNTGGNIADKVGQAVQQIGSQIWAPGTTPPESVYGKQLDSANIGYAANPASSADTGYYASAASYGSGSPEPPSSMGFGPIQVGPISVSSGSNTGFAYYNLTPRPAGLPGNGNTSLLFPLSIATAITSPFGWRTHPVMGYGRFHTGTDLGADLGTPVLAAYAGQVAIADWLGGYGLTVVLNHQKQSQETLYAHLSELFVKPGEWVKQGDTIGRVGSTGMSTGPHLHFEIRQMTDRGWVAIDPGSQLEFALARMIGTLEIAKGLPQMPQIVAAKDLKGLKDLENDLPQLPPLPVGMDIEVHNLQPPFPELLKAEASGSKNNQVAKPKTQKQASR
ncbi:MAG: M23 family metallopeptidase [Microcoleus sp. CSU_2_2]|nr:M23 family metallopeptidase [Microcoleus sp. CSU_2_2]